MGVCNHSQDSRATLLSLIGEDYRNIRIPSIQRDFVLGSDDIKLRNIFNDIMNNMEEDKDTFFSTLMLFDDKCNPYLIYDGQQRITTLMCILQLIGSVIPLKVFGYENNSRPEFMELMQDLANGKDITQTIPKDTSCFSLINMAKSLDFSGINLDELQEYILTKVKFNVVSKDNLTNMDQYFIDLNDGLELTDIQVFKAELTHHLYYSDFSEDIKDKWIYSIDNELQYGSNNKEEHMLARMYCIFLAYDIIESGKTFCLDKVSEYHLTIAYDMVYRLINEGTYPINDYFHSYSTSPLLWDLHRSYYNFKGDNRDLSLVDFFENYKVDYGAVAVLFAKDEVADKAFKALFNSYTETKDCVARTYKNKSIPYKATYYKLSKNPEDSVAFTGSKYNDYQLKCKRIIQIYLKVGNDLWGSDSLKNYLGKSTLRFELINSAIQNDTLNFADYNAYRILNNKDFETYKAYKDVNLFVDKKSPNTYTYDKDVYGPVYDIILNNDIGNLLQDKYSEVDCRLRMENTYLLSDIIPPTLFNMFECYTDTVKSNTVNTLLTLIRDVGLSYGIVESIRNSVSIISVLSRSNCGGEFCSPSYDKNVSNVYLTEGIEFTDSGNSLITILASAYMYKTIGKVPKGDEVYIIPINKEYLLRDGNTDFSVEFTFNSSYNVYAGRLTS